MRSTALDIITRLLDHAAFVCVHVVGRFSKDFSEMRGLRSRGFQLHVDQMNDNSTVRGIMKSSLISFDSRKISFVKLFGESGVLEFSLLTFISFIINFRHFDVDSAVMDVSWKLKNEIVAIENKIIQNRNETK